MKSPFFIFLVLLLPTFAISQTFKIKMDAPNDDKGAGVIQLTNGNIIYFGSTSVNVANTDHDLFFSCFTSSGILNWTKHIPLAGSQIAFTVKEGANNTIFALGRNVSNESILLVKLDATGNVLWSKTYVIAGNSAANPLSIDEAPDGSLVFLCTYYSNTKGYVFKTDATGNLVWTKYFNPTSPPASYMRWIKILSDGNYLLSGYADTETGSSCLIKMDPNGNVIWQRNNKSAYVFEIFQGLCELDNGDIMAGGYVYNNERSMMIFKYNSLGNLLWSKTYTMAGFHMIIMSMQKTLSNDIIATGVRYQGGYSQSTSQNFICKISSSTGNVVWMKLLGQSNDGIMVQCATTMDIALDGGILTAGTVLNGGNGSYAQLIKTDSLGGLPSCSLLAVTPTPITINYSSAINNSFTNITPVVSSLNLQTVDYNMCVNDVCNPTTQILNVQLGPDTNICGTINLALSPNLSNTYTYNWSTNEQTPSINITSPGTYWVTVSDLCGNVGRDTIEISSGSGSINLLPDTSLCVGASFTIDLSAQFQQVLWNDGSTALIRNINTAGIYSVVANTSGCILIDSMVVSIITAPSAVHLPADTSLCEGQSIILSIPYPSNGTILWNTFSTTNQISVNSGGNYWVSVSNSCGSVSDTIAVIFNDIQLSLPQMETFCTGNSINIDLGPFAGGILWNDGSTNSLYSINQQGTYSVTMSLGQCQKSDTITVYESFFPDLVLPPDFNVCQGEYFEIVPVFTDSMSIITWNQGAFPLPSATLNTAGQYWVTETNACGSITDTLVVAETIVTPVEILGSTLLCENETIMLSHTGNTNFAYWPNGSYSSTYEVSAPGLVVLTNEINGCKAYDSVIVQAVAKPEIDLGVGGMVCIGDKLEINAGIPPNYPFSWYWSTGAQNQSIINVTESGVYWVAVLYCDKLITDTVSLDIILTNGMLYVPNVFTPNEDLVNDKFLLVGNVENITNFSIDIFNRWGAKIYSSQDVLSAWNGKYGDKQVPDGVYVYIASYTDICGNETTLHGHVTVAR